MPDLRELHDTFFPAGDGLDKTASAPPASTASAADELARALGITKASSAAPSTENEMKSLTDIYNGLTNLEKQAAAKNTNRSAALEKKAEVLARREMTKEAAMMKTAQEYDAAGRIMARGFVDEFQTCIAHIEKVGMEGYVAGQIENDLDPSKPVSTGNTWGQDDAVEVAIRDLARDDAPILVLRGYPNGHFESSVEAGASPRSARRAGRDVEYAATVEGAKSWCAELRVPWDSLGIEPKRGSRFQFNISVRKLAPEGVWLMWLGTGAHTWDIDKAGVLELSN